MKAESTIRKQEKELRKFIDALGNPKDKEGLIQQRIAYVIEDTLRWVRLKTEWNSRLQEAKDNANILMKELK